MLNLRTYPWARSVEYVPITTPESLVSGIFAEGLLQTKHD